MFSRVSQLPAPYPHDLWLVDLSEPLWTLELACLSKQEQERAAKFVLPSDRRRFMAAHSAVRRLLSEQTGQAPHSLMFSQGKFGKPYLVDYPSLYFNLSHSDDIALIAFLPKQEVGVDVEMIRTIEDVELMAERHFTSSEQAVLRKARVEDRERVFLTGWTRKEACLKAIGSGLVVAPETFEAGVDEGLTVVEINTPTSQWSVEISSFVHPRGFVGSIARVCKF